MQEVMNMEIYLAYGLVVALGLVFGLKTIARWKLTRGRMPLPLEEIHRDVQSEISFKAFELLWGKVGEAFSIDPKLVRPSDRLRDFVAADTWTLGKGSEMLEQWLQERNVTLPGDLESILDLAKRVETSSGGESK